MSDYISREDVVSKIEHLRDKCGNDEMAFALNWAKALVIKIPVADAKPVVHGTWIPYTEEDDDGCKYIGHRCSICNEWEGFAGDCNFCPNCGADMRKEKKR